MLPRCCPFSYYRAFGIDRARITSGLRFSSFPRRGHAASCLSSGSLKEKRPSRSTLMIASAPPNRCSELLTLAFPSPRARPRPRTDSFLNVSNPAQSLGPAPVILRLLERYNQPMGSQSLGAQSLGLDLAPATPPIFSPECSSREKERKDTGCNIVFVRCADCSPLSAWVSAGFLGD